MVLAVSGLCVPNWHEVTRGPFGAVGGNHGRGLHAFSSYRVVAGGERVHSGRRVCEIGAHAQRFFSGEARVFAGHVKRFRLECIDGRHNVLANGGGKPAAGRLGVGGNGSVLVGLLEIRASVAPTRYVVGVGAVALVPVLGEQMWPRHFRLAS